MKIIVFLAVLYVLLSTHAGEDCTEHPEQISLRQEMVQVIRAAEKVIGIGDVSRIRKIEDHEFPFVGRFRGPAPRLLGCTGTILDNKYVLGSGHCVDLLGEDPLFILNRSPYGTKGASLTKLVDQGDDWALYELQSPISYNGPYPKLKAVSFEKIRDKSLVSVGFPLEGAGDFTNSFVVDGDCKVFETTYFQRKFISNCFNRVGTSGGPVGYFEDGVFHIVAVRQGLQWGKIPEFFNQVGTIETPVSFFENRVKMATK